MASSFRRRRIVWSIILLTAGMFFYVSTYGDASFFSLPTSLKDLGFSPSSSRAGQVAIAKLKDITGRKSKQVPEVLGLLYFVSQYPDRTFNENEGGIDVLGKGSVKVEPESPVELDVYAPDGHANWDAHLKVLQNDFPVVVFSKTYCPYIYLAFRSLRSCLTLSDTGPLSVRRRCSRHTSWTHHHLSSS